MFFSLFKYTMRTFFWKKKNQEFGISYQDNLKHRLVLSKNQHTFSSQAQSGTDLLHLTKTGHCCYSQKFCKLNETLISHCRICSMTYDPSNSSITDFCSKESGAN